MSDSDEDVVKLKKMPKMPLRKHQSVNYGKNGGVQRPKINSMTDLIGDILGTPLKKSIQKLKWTYNV